MTIAASSFLDAEELSAIGFRSIGRDCLISRFARFYGADAISIGDRSRIDDYCVISAKAPVVLGRHVHLASFCLIAGGSGVHLDDFAGLGSRVAIYSESDDLSGRSLTNPTLPNGLKPGYHALPVRLGRHVIIGTASTVLPGAELDDGAAVTAHSLFRGRADPWTIHGGVPATLLRPRERDVELLESSFLEGEHAA